MVDNECGAYPAYYMLNCAHPVHFKAIFDTGYYCQLKRRTPQWRKHNGKNVCRRNRQFLCYVEKSSPLCGTRIFAIMFSPLRGTAIVLNFI